MMRSLKKFFTIAVLMIATLFILGAAQAATLTLPADTKVIEEEAFYGDTSLDEVVLPEGIERIGERAFANSSLRKINLPDSLQYVADNAFDNCVNLEHEGEPTVNPDDFDYEDNGDGTCTVTGYKKTPSGDLVIPSKSPKGYIVTSIGDRAFSFCRGFTGRLSIPDSVTSIGSSAFYGCSGFTGSLTIPDSVTNIGYGAFRECWGFTGNLTISSSVTSIGDEAFYGCSGFTGNLTIPDSVTSIGSSAFYACSGFTGSLTISNSVTSIRNYTFYGCGFTGSLTIPDSVTGIGDCAFQRCRGFNGSLTLPNSLSVIGISAFSGCSGFTGSLTLPDCMTVIRNSAFSGCSGFTGSLLIPDSVTNILSSAFAGCSGFTGSLLIPDSVVYIGDNAFSGCSGFTGSLTIPNGMRNISNGAFSGCSGFTGSLTIPDSVSYIGDGAFSGCSGFTGSLLFPDNMAHIGRSAFSGCSGFTGSLTIPDSATSIGNAAFYMCSGFTGSLTIPNGVTTIDVATFSGCSGFTGSLTIPDSVSYIGVGAFSGCSGFTGSLTIPNSVTGIGGGAFDGCSGFTGSLMISNSVKSFGYETFSGCSGFTGDLKIPDSVTSIGRRAFFGCPGFSGSLTIPNSVTSIGEEAFYGCSGFTGSLTIPNSVISVGGYAFNGCSGLTGRLSISDSVTSIGINAFTDCNFERVTVLVTSDDGTTNEVSRIAVYCPIDSYAWRWATEQSFFEPVEWDGNPSTLPEESQLTGAFTDDSITLTIGEPNKTPAGYVKSIGKDIYRVSITVAGYEMDDPVNNRYATDVFIDHHTKEVNLTDWGAFYLDTTRAPFNEPGEYTIKLWANVIEGKGELLDSMTVYVGWKGYIQGSWVETYESSTAPSTEYNGHVDNIDPVVVIKEENGRYFIQMTRTEGDTDLRWVDKDKVGSVPWNNTDTFLSMYVNNQEPGQMRSAKYTVTATSKLLLDSVVIEKDGSVLATINEPTSNTPDVYGLYYYKTDISVLSSDHKVHLVFTGYQNKYPAGSGSMDFYIVEELDDPVANTTYYVPKNGDPGIAEIPEQNSLRYSVLIASEVTILGTYPDQTKPQYYYVSYAESDSMMMRFGFVEPDNIRGLDLTNGSILDTAVYGKESGLPYCVPYKNENGQWTQLNETENAIITCKATVPVIHLYKYEGNTQYGYLRSIPYDSIINDEGSIAFIFNIEVDMRGADRTFEDDLGRAEYLLDGGEKKEIIDNSQHLGSETVRVEYFIIDSILDMNRPEWEIGLYTTEKDVNLFEKLEKRTISEESSKLQGYYASHNHALYAFFLESINGTQNLVFTRADNIAYQPDTMKNITPWKLHIQPSDADYILTVELKSSENLPDNGTYCVFYHWTNSQGVELYGKLKDFTYTGSKDGGSGDVEADDLEADDLEAADVDSVEVFSYQTKLIQNEGMDIEYYRDYYFGVIPATGILWDHMMNTEYTYLYMFENGTEYGDDQYFDQLLMYMMNGEDPLSNGSICNYLVRRICRFAVQPGDAQDFVDKLKTSPALYRNLYLISITDYDLGNLYMDKQPNKAAAYYDPNDKQIHIQNYFYSSTEHGNHTVTFFHESGHALDYNTGNNQIGNSSELFSRLKNDLEVYLTNELKNMGYDEEDRKILIKFLISAKNKQSDIDNVINDINKSRKSRGISRIMTQTDYDQLRESLYDSLKSMFNSVSTKNTYGNALMITDVSNGLMNDKIYTTRYRPEKAYWYPFGHFPSGDQAPEKEIYWYGWFGRHTEQQCREAWAEWFASQIINNPYAINANKTMFHSATTYMHIEAKRLLRYYISQHSSFAYDSIVVDESNGSFSIK